MKSKLLFMNTNHISLASQSVSLLMEQLIVMMSVLKFLDMISCFPPHGHFMVMLEQCCMLKNHFSMNIYLTFKMNMFNPFGLELVLKILKSYTFVITIGNIKVNLEVVLMTKNIIWICSSANGNQQLIKIILMGIMKSICLAI